MFRVSLFHSQARPVAAGLLSSQTKNLWAHFSWRAMHYSPLACLLTVLKLSHKIREPRSVNTTWSILNIINNHKQVTLVIRLKGLIFADMMTILVMMW